MISGFLVSTTFRASCPSEAVSTYLAGNQVALDLNHKSRKDFNYFVAREAYKRGLIPFLWDTGESVSRHTREITKDYLLPPVIQGVKDATFPY